jgi:hypothetical protein
MRRWGVGRERGGRPAPRGHTGIGPTHPCSSTIPARLLDLLLLQAAQSGLHDPGTTPVANQLYRILASHGGQTTHPVVEHALKGGSHRLIRLGRTGQGAGWRSAMEINSRLLREPLWAFLDLLMALPCTSAEASQDIRRTLLQPAHPKKGDPIPDRDLLMEPSPLANMINWLDTDGRTSRGAWAGQLLKRRKNSNDQKRPRPPNYGASSDGFLVRGKTSEAGQWISRKCLICGNQSLLRGKW